jgi:hypothetical protein
MTNKLNYDSAAALINAFRQGAKFKIIDTDGRANEVIDISARPLSPYSPNNFGLYVKTERTGTWVSFRPDGTNSVISDRLIRDESLGFVERTSVTVGDSVFGWTPGKAAAAMAAPTAAPAPVPFLKRVLAGEAFHCPATRETLVSVEFRKGTLTFLLQPEGATILERRESTNYDHEGKHKWQANRSLVAGPVPPKAPVVKTYTEDDLFNDAPIGVYETGSGTFKAVVLSNGRREVLFVSASGGVVDLLGRNCWKHTTFVKTNKDFTGSIS